MSFGCIYKEMFESHLTIVPGVLTRNMSKSIYIQQRTRTFNYCVPKCLYALFVIVCSFEILRESHLCFKRKLFASIYFLTESFFPYRYFINGFWFVRGVVSLRFAIPTSHW